MCLLVVYKQGAQPNREHLLCSARSNDDGHGYAIVVGDEVIMGRGMDFNAMLEEFCEMRSLHPQGVAMWHSRLTTHGVSDTENVHPFIVPGTNTSVVAHNGVLPSSVHPLKGDLRSDTRIFAEDVLMRQFPVLDSPRTRRRLERWIGTYNKVLVLTTDPRYRDNAYLFNEKAGHWVGGDTWYSNESYLPSLWESRVIGQRVGDYASWNEWYSERYGTHVGYSTRVRRSSVEEPLFRTDSGVVYYSSGREVAYGAESLCEICRAYAVIDGYCDECGSCASCWMHASECPCLRDGCDTCGSDPCVECPDGCGKCSEACECNCPVSADTVNQIRLAITAGINSIPLSQSIEE